MSQPGSTGKAASKLPRHTLERAHRLDNLFVTTIGSSRIALQVARLRCWRGSRFKIQQSTAVVDFNRESMKISNLSTTLVSGTCAPGLRRKDSAGLAQHPPLAVQSLPWHRRGNQRSELILPQTDRLISRCVSSMVDSKLILMFQIRLKLMWKPQSTQNSNLCWRCRYATTSRSSSCSSPCRDSCLVHCRG